MKHHAMPALMIVAALLVPVLASAQQSQAFRNPVKVVADARLAVGKTDGIPLFSRRTGRTPSRT